MITPSNVLSFFGGFRGDRLTSALFGGQTAAVSAGQAVAELKLAQQNESRDVARKLRDPQVARELRDFEAAVARARTPEDLLNNPSARRVLLTANGLGDQVNATGLAKRALLADLTDTRSAPYQLREIQPAWLATARTYDFAKSGLSVLRQPTTMASIADAYAQVRWQEDLEAKAPGLSFALTFVKNAATFTDPIRILGSAVGREVVTGAFGIPPQLAFQPIETQERVIASRIDFDRMDDRKYVEDIARRYLINKAGTGLGQAGSVFA